MRLKMFVFILGFTSYYGMNSCSNPNIKSDKPSKEDLKARIKEMEDSLKGLQVNIQEVKQIPNLTHFELINRLLDYYHNYPEDSYSAECLDKVHMKYSGMNIHQRAVEYADRLLEKFPKYVNRALVLESQGSAYDIFIQPRDTSKVRKYYTMLLEENPKMEKDKAEGIRDRLRHLDMNFDQFIEYKMKSIQIQ
jgi:tetratricopeptide (TPR) repeat protein